jgi:hypothetical protein
MVAREIAGRCQPNIETALSPTRRRPGAHEPHQTTAESVSASVPGGLGFKAADIGARVLGSAAWCDANVAARRALKPMFG